MKVVLDTNVLISALISPHNPPDLILQSWLAGDFELLTSGEIYKRKAVRQPIAGILDTKMG